MTPALPPLPTLALWSATFSVCRAEPALFGALALIGYAPLAAAVALAVRLDTTHGLGRGGAPLEVQAALAFAVTLALAWRSFTHAALLHALERRLSAEAITPFAALRNSAGRAFDCALVGGVVSLLGVLSGMLAFAPAALLGGVVLLALPRVVYDGARPLSALLGGGTAKAVGVCLLGWLFAAVLFANLALAVQVLLGAARTFFDADVGFASALLSFDNRTYVALITLAAFGLCEPLRVIAAGLTALEATSRPRGLDLRARLDALPSFSSRAAGRRTSPP